VAGHIESARPKSLRSCALGVVALLIVLRWATPEQSFAQGAFRATPHVGGWFPIGVVHEEVVNGDVVRRAQVGDIMVGGRAGIGFADGFAIEFSLGCSPGQVARTDRSGTADVPGLALLASTRLTRLVRMRGEFDGHFAAGAGVLRRSGRGWGGTHTTPALIAAVGIETALIPGSAFRMEIEIHASRGRRAAPGPPPWRGDVVLSFGIVLPSPRR